MIHVLSIDNKQVELYNTERNEIKHCSLLQLKQLLDRGFKIDNDDKVVEMLNGKKFKYYLGQQIGFHLYESINQETGEVTEVTQLNLDTSEYANATSYMIVYTSAREFSLAVVENSYIWSLEGDEFDSRSIPVEYAVHSGTTYEQALEHSKELPEGLRENGDSLRMFGYDDLDIEPLSKPDGLLRFHMTGEYHESPIMELPQGSMLAYLKMADIDEGKSIIANQELLAMYFDYGRAIGNLKLLDLRKASMTHKLLMNTDFMRLIYVEEVYLPEKLETLSDVEIGNRQEIYKDSDLTSYALMVKNLHIPKGIKSIVNSTIAAYNVIIEDGIQLETATASTIVCIHAFMESDPRREEFMLESKREQSKARGTTEISDIPKTCTTALNFGKHKKFSDSAFFIRTTGRQFRVLQTDNGMNYHSYHYVDRDTLNVTWETPDTESEEQAE